MLIFFVTLNFSKKKKTDMYFKEYLYNVTKKDKRNVNKIVVVFVEAVATIMLTPGAHYLEMATSLYSSQGTFFN